MMNKNTSCLKQIYHFWVSVLIFILLPSILSADVYREISPLPIEKGIFEKVDGTSSISFFLKEPAGVELNNYPIQGGIPLRKGELFDGNTVQLFDDRGESIPVQSKALSHWWEFEGEVKKEGENSIKWLLLNFRTNLPANSNRKYTLKYGKNIKSIRANSGVEVKQEKGLTEILTGPMKAVFNQNGVLEQVLVRDKSSWVKQLKEPMEVFTEINYKELPKYNQWTLLTSLDEKKHWKFAIEKDESKSKSWSSTSFNDQKWEQHDPAQSWENQGYPEYDGYAWYRSQFKTTELWNGRDVYLEFRHPDWWHNKRKYWVYLNGTLVGEVSKKTKKINNHFRLLLKKKFLKSNGDNYLAIRAYDAGDGIGGLMCKPYIRARYDEKVDGPRIKWSGKYSSLNDKNAKLRILEQGAEKVVVYVNGWLTDSEQKRVSQYRCFYTFYQNKKEFDFTYNFTTTHNPAQFRYDSVGVRLPLIKSRNREAIFGGELGDLNSWYKVNLEEHKRLSLYQYHDGPSRYPGIPTLVENPLNLKYQILSKELYFAEGKKSQGWAGVTNGRVGAIIMVKNFWQSYPSEISIERDSNALLAYMWPKESKELDLRGWGDRMDGSWDKVEKLADNGDKYLNKILKFSQNAQFAYKGDALPPSNSLGRGWTRKMKFKFSADSFKGQHLPELAKAYHYSILPFSTSQYNCSTGAFAYDLHPYDPVNFPVFENFWNACLVTAKNVTFERLNVYGMFYYGSMMMNFFENRRVFKFDAKRRWFHQESGDSPSLAPFIQYFRIGYYPYFEFAEAIANFGMDVSIRSYHMSPLKVGYAGKHQLNVFSNDDPSHTNLEGISNYYFLTGDSRTQVFLEERNHQYLNESMYSFSKRGKPLDRVHDGALYNRIVVWNVFGDPKMKSKIHEGFKFFRKRHKEGYTSCGRVSYTKRRMKTAWYYLRSPLCLEFFGKPVVLAKPAELSEKFLDRTVMTNYEYFEFRLNRHAKSVEEMEKLIDPLKTHGGKSNHTKLLAGDIFSSTYAYYKAKLPVISHPPLEIRKRFGPHFRILKDLKSYDVRKGYYFEPIAFRKYANASPFKILKDSAFESTKINKKTFGLYHVINDQAKAYDKSIGKKDFLWDFGSLSDVGEGHIGINTKQVYPYWKGFEVDKNFTGFPFGASSWYAGVKFELIDPLANDGKGYLELNRGDEVSIKVKKKSNRLFFLGQVKQGGVELAGDHQVTYTIIYEGGKKETVKLLPGVHYDGMYNFVSATPEAAAAKYIRRSRSMGDYLHLNVFGVKLDRTKVVKMVKIKSQTDGFCLFAMSAEVRGKEEVNETVQVEVPSSYTPGDAFDIKLGAGWYKLIFDFDAVGHNKQVFLEANGAMLSGGFFIPDAVEMSFPVHSKGVVTVKAHISGVEKPLNLFKAVRAVKLKKAVKWTKQRKSVRSLFKYGLQNSGKGNGLIESATRHGTIDYPEKGNLLSDYVPISGRNFCAEVPNGFYEVSMLLFSPLEQEYEVDVNGSKVKTFLPKNYFTSIEEIKCQSYKVLKAYVKIENNFLKIKFPNSKAIRISYEATPYFNQFVGIRALKLKSISNSMYKKGMKNQRS